MRDYLISCEHDEMLSVAKAEYSIAKQLMTTSFISR